jgi:hypothetical protein
VSVLGQKRPFPKSTESGHCKCKRNCIGLRLKAESPDRNLPDIFVCGQNSRVVAIDGKQEKTK